MGTEFASREPFRKEHPRVLAIYCSDGRFTTAVEEMAASRGHGAVDTLTLPGGPGLFSYSARYSERDATRGATDFLIRNHGIGEVILVAHEGCGHYASRYERRSAEERERIQIADLRNAVVEIGRMAPRVAVEAFFARTRDGHVTFEALEPEARRSPGR